MKKIFTLLCICCLGFGAMAQLPINLGVHGGISSNRIKFKDIPQAIGTQANTGYMVGAFMRVNLGKLYLEPALNYSHKRSVIEEKAQALGLPRTGTFRRESKKPEKTRRYQYR